MRSPRRAGVRLHGLFTRPGVRRFSRYVMGSGVAFAASQLTFLALYGFGLLSPQVASVWAFAVGVPVNYVLNRRWAWRRRGRPSLRSELVPYATVIGVSVAASAVGTAAADRWLQSMTLPRLVDVVVVGGTFAVVNAALFGAKYLLLDRLVFNRRPRRAAAERRVRDVEPVP